MTDSQRPPLWPQTRTSTLSRAVISRLSRLSRQGLPSTSSTWIDFVLSNGRRSSISVSGSYFYGQDLLLEKALQTSEGAYAHALTEIIATDYEVTDKHRSLLRHFWLLQHLRTEAASVRALQMTSSMREAAGVPPEEFRMGIREAVLASMRAFVGEMDAVGDLKVCLLRNRTPTPFITSDNPAVLANRWYLTSSRTQSKSFGLHSAGALLLLPLTPEILCLGYDGDAYSLPHEKGWITVKREADVLALNQHQFLNCLANIYVKDAAHRALVCSAYDGIIHLRPNPRHKLHYAVLDGSNDEYSRYKVVGDKAMAPPHNDALIHVQTIHGRPEAWPAQLRWRPGGCGLHKRYRRWIRAPSLVLDLAQPSISQTAHTLNMIRDRPESVCAQP